jgi:hypothetical protein
VANSPIGGPGGQGLFVRDLIQKGETFVDAEIRRVEGAVPRHADGKAFDFGTYYLWPWKVSPECHFSDTSAALTSYFSNSGHNPNVSTESKPGPVANLKISPGGKNTNELIFQAMSDVRAGEELLLCYDFKPVEIPTYATVDIAHDDKVADGMQYLMDQIRGLGSDGALGYIRRNYRDVAKVGVSAIHGLGLFNNLKGRISPGMPISVVARGEPHLQPHPERCCAVPGGYLTWEPVTAATEACLAGGAANECTKKNPINAVLKLIRLTPLRQTKNEQRRDFIVILIACADILPQAEIVTYYGNGYWQHRAGNNGGGGIGPGGGKGGNAGNSANSTPARRTPAGVSAQNSANSWSRWIDDGHSISQPDLTLR